MTIGSGIFFSTILVLLVLCLRYINLNRKWGAIGRVLAALVVLCMLTVAAVWLWARYSNRPVAVHELSGVRLGMRPVEVKLALGAAQNDSVAPETEKDRASLVWGYWTPSTDALVVVHFEGPSIDSLGVSIVCEKGGYEKVLGLGRFSTEQEVVGKLGPPSTTSISRDGLSKIISYKQWHAAYGFEKAQVNQVCVMSNAAVVFRDEYQEPE